MTVYTKHMLAKYPGASGAGHRSRVTITRDYEVEQHRLCWKRRDGTGRWGSGVCAPMTKDAAKRLVAFMNREYPDFEHWTETNGDQI